MKRILATVLLAAAVVGGTATAANAGVKWHNTPTGATVVAGNSWTGTTGGIWLRRV